jgi:single-stranded-DNA-specific exonuclease
MRWTDLPTSTLPSPLPDLHPLVAQALARRGILTPEAALAFLDPSRYQPAPASDLPGMEQAVSRLQDAVRLGQRICVWGDFDVDGQTATAVLVSALRGLGADPVYYLPVRSRESHGVSLPALKTILDNGAQLLVTCDTGIGSHEAITYAHRRGVDTVLTDHHELPPELPKAAVIVTPRLLPVSHPLAALAGVGVAYKLAEALYEQSAARLQPDDLLDLVALGLIADIAALTGDCRYLVQKGLEVLRRTGRPGLQIMMKLAELDPAHLTEEHVGFTLGPRLNALGRLGDANPAVELLTTSDPARARLLAAQLENYNAQRRLLTEQVTRAAEAQLRADPALLAAPVLIASNPYWPAGVIGIAAARLVERYGKPAIVFSAPPGELARGSARSVEGLHITEAIAAQKDLLVNYGGHPMAAGLALLPENLPAFQRRMQKTVGQMVEAQHAQEPSLAIDAWLSLPEVTLDLAAAIEPLSPFGPGNPKLLLASRGLGLQKSEPIGRNKEHVKLTVADEAGNARSVLWWNGGGETLPEGRFDLAYTVRASDWRGSLQVQIVLVDFHNVEGKPAEVQSRRIEVVDYRYAPDRTDRLRSLPAGTLVWAEGREKDRVNGMDRFALAPAPALAIWTVPPSPEELRLALETVHPQTVYLFAADPPLENTENFLARLTGLIKYAINHRDGQATYTGLAAATSQRLVTVQHGLNWLVSLGNVVLKKQESDLLWLAAGTSVRDPGGAARLFAETQTLLAETAAFRSHFQRADAGSLIVP